MNLFSSGYLVMLLVGFHLVIPSQGQAEVATRSPQQTGDVFSDPTSCGNLRSDRGGGVFENIPLFRQETIDLCGAMTGAEVLEAYRQTYDNQHPGFLVSPISMAIENTRQKVIAFRKSGRDVGAIVNTWDLTVLNAASPERLFYYGDSKVKVCDHRFLRQFFQQTSYLEQLSTANLVRTQTGKWTLNQFINALFSSLKTYNDARKTSTNDERKEAERSAMAILKLLADQAGSDVDLPRPATITEAYLKMKPDDSVESFAGLVAAICDEHSATISWKQDYSTFPRAELQEGVPWIPQMAARIQSQLSTRNSQPIALGICSGLMLNGKSYNGVSVKTRQFALASDCAPHALVVTGSRWNHTNRRCELLVRHSEGAVCPAPPPGKSTFYPWQCDRGSLWIDEEALLKNTYSVFWLNR